MAQFPTMDDDLSRGESPSKYDIKPEVADIRNDTDGGYETRRPRFTRAPRNLVKTGFIGLSHADYQILLAFWNAHLTTVAFTYWDYMNDVMRQVRFDKEPDWKPETIGKRRLWSPNFELKEI